jgi:hypothetical protein
MMMARCGGQKLIDSGNFCVLQYRHRRQDGEWMQKKVNVVVIRCRDKEGNEDR